MFAGSRLGAGRWGTLALPLVAAWLLMAGGCREFHPSQLDATASDLWERSYDLAPGGELQVVGNNGSISIERGAGPKVEVKAERVVKAASESIARDVLPRLHIREDVTGEKVVVQTQSLGGIVFGVEVMVNYQVTVPSGIRVRARTANGPLVLKGLDAQANGATENGNITATALSGGVDVRAVNGDVSVDLAAFEREPAAVRTTNGRVELTAPSTINATVLANVTNGSVEVSDIAWEPSAENTRRRVRGRLNSGGSPIELNTVNGSIKIHSR